MPRDYKITLLFSIIALLGCAKMIRVDADTYMKNQSFYEGKHVLIKADLEDVLDQYKLFKGKNIELTAPVTHYGDWGFSGWYLILEKDGKSLRCYEERYRYYLPWKALYLVRWAKSEGGEVTARGKLRKDGIELCQLTYKSLSVNTNAVPFVHEYPNFYGWYHFPH